MTYDQLKDQMILDGFSSKFADWWISRMRKYAADDKRTNKVCARIQNNYTVLKLRYGTNV